MAAMTLDMRTRAALRRLRRRSWAAALLPALPPAAVVAWLASQRAGPPAALVALAVIFLGAAALAVADAARYDRRWLARALNARCPTLEDSAELALLEPPPVASALVALQRRRLEARLAALAWPELRPALPLRATAASAAAALVLLLAALVVLRPGRESATQADAVANRSAAVLHAELRITPPTYTRLPSRRLETLDARLPAGSRVDFRLRFAGEIRAARLVFHDGSQLELTPGGDGWRGSREVAAPALYRLQLQGAGAAAVDTETLHRLDVIADAAPQIQVQAPDRTLSLLAPGQTSWPLLFEARDDYGLGAAELSVTLAQGSGENVSFSERRLPLQGEGDARQRRYAQTLDLTALGFVQGDDLVVRLQVADNRAPEANLARSAAFILRWPAEDAAAEGEGVEGVVQKTLPAYFRSQRQVIIDTEALLAERARLTQDQLLARSDAIGVDQRLLRLRYGQFLGEESETPGEQGHEEHSGAAADATREATHGAPDEPAQAGVGEDSEVLAEFGHTHDSAEAATLLDPDTRRILKAALDEMWQAEGHLRIGEPDLALPYEYQALDYVKQVQQASRIYLARVGADLPEVDPARRLSGDRTGLTDRERRLAARQPDAAAVADAWRELDAPQPPDLTALRSWLQAHATQPEALTALQALDRVAREPACAGCRAELRSRLWPLLPAAAAAVRARAAPDAAAQRWLESVAAQAPTRPGPKAPQ